MKIQPFQKETAWTARLRKSYDREFRFEEMLGTTFNVFRGVSLLSTSAVYLLTSEHANSVKLAVFAFLLLSSFVFVHLYDIARKRAEMLVIIVFIETLVLSVILVLTGGLDSPFIWYALNPIIIASVWLPLYYGWALVPVYLTVIMFDDIYIRGNHPSALFFMLRYADLILTLLLMTLVIQIFSRLYIMLSGQSNVLKQQQKELFNAYSFLAENHQLSRALTGFQRKAVVMKLKKDVYDELARVTEKNFPLEKAEVIAFETPISPSHLSPKTLFSMCGSGLPAKSSSAWLKVLEKRRNDLNRENIIMADDKSWLAIPIWLDSQNLSAVFVGMLRRGAKPADFQENLTFFINFAEQAVRNLHYFKRTERSMQRLTSLYEAVETISSRSDIKEVVDLFAAYARVLTGSLKVVFWLDKTTIAKHGKKVDHIYTVKGEKETFPESLWYESILHAWSQIKDHPEPVEKVIYDDDGKAAARLLCVPVKSRSQCFGLLGVLQPDDNPLNTAEVMQTLTFLSNLAAVAIDRNVSELFADKILVLDEQNRIANEIHDSISQNLFSVVYGVEALLKQKETLTPDMQKQMLSTIRDVSTQTAKELRLLIYRLSPRHRGDDTFVREIDTHLKGLAELNQIDIDFEVSGKEEFINAGIRRAFYRIVKEATNNAVKHGRGSEIKVSLRMDPFNSQLSIQDNGVGFDPDLYGYHTVNADNKLGIVNMRELALSLKGTLDIESKIGTGTTVTVSVPTSPVP